MRQDSKGLFVSATPKTKYKEGTFGYWWTVTMGNEDIQGKRYEGSIFCNGENLTSLEGAPKEVDGFFDCGNNSDLEELPDCKGPFTP